MKRFARFFISKPMAVCLAALLLTAVGFLAAFFAPKELCPEKESTLEIILSCPDMSAKDVKSEITAPVETALNSLEGVRQTLSSTFGGEAKVTVYLDGADAGGTTQSAIWIRLSTLSLPESTAVSLKTVGDEFLRITAAMPETEAKSLSLKLARLKGVERVDVSDVLTADKTELKSLTVYASPVRADRLSRQIRDTLSQSGVNYSVVYDYGESIAAGSALWAVWLIIAFVATCFGLLLYLKKAAATVAAASSVAVSSLTALALMWAIGRPLSPLSAGGLIVGLAASALMASAAVYSLKRGNSAAADDICAGRTAASAPVAADIAMTALCIMLPLCFIRGACTAFALPCLIVCGLGLITSLTLSPTVYRLLGRLSNAAVKPTAPPKNVTAQEVEIPEAAATEKTAPVFADYTIPSLDDIARLDRKARRAVRRTRFAADRPMTRLRKGYERFLSVCFKRRAVLPILMIAIIAAAVGLATVSATTLRGGTATRTFTVTDYADTGAVASALSTLDGVENVIILSDDGAEKIAVRTSTDAEKVADSAKKLLSGEPKQPVISVRDDVFSSPDGMPQITLSGANPEKLALIASEIASSLESDKAVRRVTVKETGDAAELIGGDYRLTLTLYGDLSIEKGYKLLSAAADKTIAGTGAEYVPSFAAKQARTDLLRTAAALGVSILLVYFYAALRLGGLIKALALAASLLPAACGGLFAAACGLGLNAAVFIGMATAMCFAAATSLRILLVAEYGIREGYDPVTSSKTAAAVSLKRTVYSLTIFAFAIVPMCFAFGSGIFLMRSAAIAAICGIVLSTLLALTALPVTFSLMRRSRPLLALEAPVYDLDESGIEVEIATTPSQTGDNLPMKKQ